MKIKTAEPESITNVNNNRVKCLFESKCLQFLVEDALISRDRKPMHN